MSNAELTKRSRIEPSSMPSETTTIPPETPPQIRYSFDKIIGWLNTQWDLDIPSIHGTQEAALKQSDAEHSLAKQCAGRIRYLCFRECKLDKVLKDFEDDTPRICSDWVWKPSQEKGTLPQMPVTKSFIHTRPALPRKHRRPLLERLFVLLDEEFKLARDSEVYERTSFSAKHDGAGIQDRENRLGTAASGPSTTAASVTRRQATTKAFDDTHEAASQTTRSLEATKRKSSELEKVRMQTLIN
jgi:hypothetical protein